jgi:hypothetical protein
MYQINSRNVEQRKLIVEMTSRKKPKQLSEPIKHRPSWAADSSSASQEIPHILLNPNADCPVQNGLPFSHTLTHLNSIQISPSSFFNTPFSTTPQIYALVYPVACFL